MMRKLRKVRNQYSISIPSEVVEFIRWNAGEQINIINYKKCLLLFKNEKDTKDMWKK